MNYPGQSALIEGLQRLINPSKLDDFLGCAVQHNEPLSGKGPKTGLVYVRFREDEPQVLALAEFLWSQCIYYALPRRRRLKLQKALDEDFSLVSRVYKAVQNSFIEFNKKSPSRASEIGEVLAYCIVQHHLNAPQVAAKMALKTANNMPIHGLDGIHATFENDALTIYFLEAKLSGSANKGVKEYAKSAAGFLANRKQYLREYEIVTDLGHLDSLEGDAREAALEYFDILGKPQLPRRERFVGVICYSEKCFANRIPVTDGPVDIHETDFVGNYRLEHKHHQDAAKRHIEAEGGDVAKTSIFFVAVPNVEELREAFYAAMGAQQPTVKPRQSKPRKKRS